MNVYDQSLTRWLCESIAGFTRVYKLILFLSLSMQRCYFSRHELVLVVFPSDLVTIYNELL